MKTKILSRQFLASAGLIAAAFLFSGTAKTQAANINPPSDTTAPFTVPLAGTDQELAGDWSTFVGNLIVGSGAGDKGKLVIYPNVSLGTNATVTVSRDATVFFNGVYSIANAVTLAGGSTKESYGQLRVDGGANFTGTVTLLDDSSIGCAGSSTGTVSGVIGGNYGLTLQAGNVATSFLVLSGNNTYSGKTTITNAGYVGIASANAFGTGSDLVINGGGLYTTQAGGIEIAKSTVTLSGNSRLGYSAVGKNGKLTFTGATTISNNSNISVASAVEFSGVTTIGTNCTIAAASAVEFTGATTISGGTITTTGTSPVEVSGRVTATSGFVHAGSGELKLTGGGTAGGISQNGSGTVGLASTLTLAGDWTISALSTPGGSLAGDAVININGNVTSNGFNGFLGTNSVNQNAILNINGTLAATNAGAFVLGNNLTTTTGTVNIYAGGKFSFTNTSTTATTGTGGGGLVLGRDYGKGTLNLFQGGTLETDVSIRDNNNVNYGTAIVNLDGGTIVATTNLNSADLFNKTKASTSYTVNVLAGGAVIDTQANNITIGTGANKVGLTGSTGDGGLTKKGTGTLTLGTTNTYNGATVIEAGTLKLAAGASIANTSGVNVKNADAVFDVTGVTGGFTLANGKTLSGNGTVLGSMTISGTIAPGNSVGTLTLGSVGDTVTISETGKIVIEVESAASFDKVIVGGTLAFDPRAEIQLEFVNGYRPVLNESYDIFTGSISTSGTNITSNLGTDYQFSWDGTSGSIGITAIPEPSTYALLAGGLLAGLALLRRRKR